MSYATFDDFQARYGAVEEISGNAREVIETAIDAAARQIDSLLGWEPPTQDALRIDTINLGTDYQVAALKRATLAQAAYRLTRGENDMLGPDGIASIAGISFTSQQPPRLSPEALDLLTDVGLYRRSGLAVIEEEAEA